MRDRLADLGDADAVAVFHARPRTLRGWRSRFVTPLRVATDEALAAYRALGFGTADDGTPLGGDLVVDRHGRIAYLYRQRAAHGRPPIDELVAAAGSARDR